MEWFVSEKLYQYVEPMEGSLCVTLIKYVFFLRSIQTFFSILQVPSIFYYVFSESIMLAVGHLKASIP
jgi:hypothetical protein